LLAISGFIIYGVGFRGENDVNENGGITSARGLGPGCCAEIKKKDKKIGRGLFRSEGSAAAFIPPTRSGGLHRLTGRIADEWRLLWLTAAMPNPAPASRLQGRKGYDQILADVMGMGVNREMLS
jgi:hypothetical protein